MASADTIRKGIIALLRKLDTNPKPKVKPLGTLKIHEGAIEQKIPHGGGKLPVELKDGPGPKPFDTPTAVESPHSYTGQPHPEDVSVFDLEFKAGRDSNFETLDELTNRVADKGERAVKRAKTQELDLEGKEFEKGVQRVEDVRFKEITEDPLFPNPQHPRSLTGRAITKEAQKTEINAEVQDIIGRFKELFDVEKLKKANLKNNPTASRIQDAWKTLSTNANGARAGDVNALKKVRAIDEWLHKTANKETTPLANLEGPRREIPANVILQDILEDMTTGNTLPAKAPAPRAPIDPGNFIPTTEDLERFLSMTHEQRKLLPQHLKNAYRLYEMNNSGRPGTFGGRTLALDPNDPQGMQNLFDDLRDIPEKFKGN